MTRQAKLRAARQAELYRQVMADKPPSVAGSPTSEAAAESIEHCTETLRLRVLRVIRGAGDWGATDEEVQRSLGMNPSTQRPRRIELVKLGLVYDSGTTRWTVSGRRAVVWRAHRPASLVQEIRSDKLCSDSTGGRGNHKAPDGMEKPATLGGAVELATQSKAGCVRTG